jgi:hypothetical protein
VVAVVNSTRRKRHKPQARNKRGRPPGMREATIAEIGDLALRARLQGMPWAQVAALTGLSRRTAIRAHDKLRAEVGATFTELTQGGPHRPG